VICKPRERHYHAIVVGSGVAGALVAQRLGRARKHVLVLEAGSQVAPNLNEYVRRFYLASAKVPESPYSPELVTTDNQGKEVPTNPSTLNAGRPTSLTLDAGSWRAPEQSYLIQEGPLPFSSTYERIGGGTAMHWLGTSLRLLPNDFRMKSKYQQFVDWPIKYDDLERWYHEAEEELGVSANRADQEYHGLKITADYPMPGIPQSLVDHTVA
jgi:choline dehydrogenase-like flavoprotein